MRDKVSDVLIAVGVSLVGAPLAWAVVPEYSVLDLGTLGGVKSEAHGLNNAGQVVGWAKTSAGTNRAFLTAPNNPINPATDMLPLLSGGTSNFAYGINTSGQAVGDGSSSGGDRAYRYGAGTIATLPTLGGSWSYSYGLNDSGQVVGGAAKPKSGNNYPTRPFLYSGTTMYDLGTLGGQDGYAYAINSAGRIAGYAQLATSAGITLEHAFLWTPASPNGTSGSMVDLGALGGNYSYAFGMNDVGQIVGGANTAGDLAYHAFVRTVGPTPTLVDLQTLGGPSSEARAINELGMIVGYSDTVDSISHAFLYADGSMHDLNDLIPAASGWTLTQARAINDLGQIAGFGTSPSSETHGYLLSPLPTWRVDASGVWSGASNWLGGTPDGAGAEVRFTGAISAARTITLDTPRTVGRIAFDNAASYTLAGPGTLTISGSSPATGLEVRSGVHTISAPLQFAGAIATISLADSSGLNLEGSLSGALSQISIASGATLNLTSNDLVIDYTPGNSPLTSITAALVSGYNNGQWTGDRINSSTAASNSAHTTAIGIGEAAALGIGSFNSQAIDGSAILLKYTYYGDANLDGQVDISDLGALATAWQTGGVWSQGDFDYSGFVDISDLGKLATNWQAGVGNPLGPSFDEALASVGLAGANVPEPAAVGLLACGALLLRRVRNDP